MTPDDPEVTEVPPAAGPDAVAVRVLALAAARDGVLVALDHDGTLSPIAPTPDAAVLPDATRAAVADLAARARVAVVSGRGLADLEHRLAGLPITLVAEHGLRVRLPDGERLALADPPAPHALATLRERLAALLAGRAGWIVEDKDVGIAVHHRGVTADEAAALLPEVRAALAAAAAAGGGSVQDGHAVLELRAAAAEKGAALRWLAARDPGLVPVMVGDDRTDESALAAAEDLGGIGVLVASTPRASAASVRLPDPTAVTALLAAIAAGLSRG